MAVRAPHLGPDESRGAAAAGLTDGLTDELRHDFDTSWADAARDEVNETWLRIGGRPVLLRVIGPQLARHLRAPVGHLATPAPGHPAALVISCWSSPGPPGLAELVADRGQAAERVRYADIDEDRCLMAWPAERLVQAFARLDGRDEAWWWVPDVDEVATFELAMPFRPILHWWTDSAGLQMVHAAAVGTLDGGAVLLGGVSGSGKSTTSLWSLRAPSLRFLGDDYVLVDPDPPATAFSLYTTAKIHAPDRARVPHVRAEVVGRQEDDKLVAFLGRRFADRIVESLPLRAVLLPRRTAAGPSITPIDDGEALRRLGPSTVLQFPAAHPQRSLATLARLVRTLPCHDLALGPDPGAAATAVEAFLSAPTGGFRTRDNR